VPFAPTPSVTSRVPLPASASAMLTPLMASTESSLAVCAAGTVMTGASFTGVTVMLTVPVASLPPPPSDSVMSKLSLVTSSPLLR